MATQSCSAFEKTIKNDASVKNILQSSKPKTETSGTVNSYSKSQRNSKENIEKNQIIKQFLNDPNRKKSLVEEWAIKNDLSIDKVGDFIGQTDNPDIHLDETNGKFERVFTGSKFLGIDEKLDEKISRTSKYMQWMVINEDVSRKDFRRRAKLALLYDENLLNTLGLDQSASIKDILNKLGINKEFNKLDDADMMDIARKAFGWPDWSTRAEERGNVAYLIFKIKLKDGTIQSGIIFTLSKSQLMTGVKLNNKNQFIMDYSNKISNILKIWAGRYYDAERKLLVTISNKIEGNQENINSLEFSLASELGYCEYCQMVISKFLQYIEQEGWKIPRMQFIFRNGVGDTNGVRKYKILFQNIF